MKDTILPKDKWEFDEEVTKCFPDMLQRSIPDYQTMRALVFTIGERFLTKGQSNQLIDLGCSNGIAVEPFITRYGAHLRYFLADVSKPMLAACRERYQGWVNCGLMKIEQMDIAERYPMPIANLTLCVLTLQFTPIEYRLQILRNAYEHTIPGGALIIVEKVLGSDSTTNALLTEEYYAFKWRNDYTKEQTDAKRKSLEHVLTPLTVGWNEELLRRAGFPHVECFWRSLNFAGWLAIR